jgi:hypothetical protein
MSRPFQVSMLRIPSEISARRIISRLTVAGSDLVVAVGSVRVFVFIDQYRKPTLARAQARSDSRR